MPRTARSVVSDEIYHVLNRGNGRAKVFHGEADYSQFQRLLHRAKSEHPIQILGYCIMPNHFHFVLRPRTTKALSRFMHWLTTTHVRRHHQRKRTCGHVWQGRYKSFRIESDAHLLMVLRYVERNPTRAGLVETARDWSWSSHRVRVGLDRSTLLDPIPIVLPEPWTEYVDTPLDDVDLTKIRQSVRRNLPY